MASSNKKKSSKYKKRSSTTNQQYWDVTKGKYATPQYANAKTQNKGYNITTNTKKYQKKLDDATRQQYEAARGQLKANENQQYQVMQANQDSAVDQMRRSRAQATATGGALGADAATQLSSILGLGQTNSALQTELANNREQTILDEQAQIYQNLVDATQYTDQNKKDLMTQATNRYGIDNDLLGQGLAASGNYLGSRDYGLSSAKYTAKNSGGGGGGSSSGGGSGGSGSSGSGNNDSSGTTATPQGPGGVEQQGPQKYIKYRWYTDNNGNKIRQGTKDGKTWQNVST